MKKHYFVGVGLLGMLLVVFYIGFVNFIDRNHVGVQLDHSNGSLVLQKTGGWRITPPWVAVARIDSRPVRVCITTSAKRAYNCKLVQFVPEAFENFVETEGFRYYELSNLMSFNSGYNEEYRGMKDVLRGYAFSAKKYKFLRVLDDYVGPP